MTNWIYQNIIIPTFQQLGKDAVSLLQVLIRDAATKDWTGSKKFNYVFTEFKERYGDASKIGDSMLNIAINILHADLKKKGLLPRP